MQNTANLIGLVKAAAKVVRKGDAGWVAPQPAQQRQQSTQTGHWQSQANRVARGDVPSVRYQQPRQQAPVNSTNASRVDTSRPQSYHTTDAATAKALSKGDINAVNAINSRRARMDKALAEGPAGLDRNVIGDNYGVRRSVQRNYNYGMAPDYRSREQDTLNNTYGQKAQEKANYAAQTLHQNWNQAYQQNPAEAMRRAQRYLNHGMISHNNRMALARAINNAFDGKQGLGESERAIYDAARRAMGADVPWASRYDEYNDYRDPRENLDVGAQKLIGYNPYMH